MVRAKPVATSCGWPARLGLITKDAERYSRAVTGDTLELAELYVREVKRRGMPEDSRSDGVASVSGGIAAELAAAGFQDAHQVARGGAGVIYRCYETALGRNVAVKLLPSHMDEESRERFLREGYAMGGLSGHPNIVNILRVG